MDQVTVKSIFGKFGRLKNTWHHPKFNNVHLTYSKLNTQLIDINLKMQKRSRPPIVVRWLKKDKEKKKLFPTHV